MKIPAFFVLKSASIAAVTIGCCLSLGAATLSEGDILGFNFWDISAPPLPGGDYFNYYQSSQINSSNAVNYSTSSSTVVLDANGVSYSGISLYSSNWNGSGICDWHYSPAAGFWSASSQMTLPSIVISGLDTNFAYMVAYYSKSNTADTSVEQHKMTINGVFADNGTSIVAPRNIRSNMPASDQADLVFSKVLLDGNNDLVFSWETAGAEFNPTVNMITIRAVAIPEPATYAWIGLGGAVSLYGFMVRRKRRAIES